MIARALHAIAIILLGFGSAAFAQTAPTITLPTKTVKILPTDDMIVVAWIDGSQITPQTAGVSASLIATLAVPGLCEVLINAWGNNPQTPALSSAADVMYADQFLIKGSANPTPPSPTIDPVAFQAAGKFRLFNRYQTAYRVNNGQVVGTPVTLPNNPPQAIVGVTPDPCLYSPAYLAAQSYPVLNGANGITASGTSVFQLNEGRLGTAGQAVNMALNGTTTPWIWSVIEFNLQGQFVFPAPQIFPTYWVYKNGQFIQSVNPNPGALQTFINLTDTSQISNTNQIQ